MEWWSDGVMEQRHNTPILQHSNTPLLEVGDGAATLAFMA
jgi:hypothetical protein